MQYTQFLDKPWDKSIVFKDIHQIIASDHYNAYTYQQVTCLSPTTNINLSCSLPKLLFWGVKTPMFTGQITILDDGIPILSTNVSSTFKYYLVGGFNHLEEY